MADPFAALLRRLEDEGRIPSSLLSGRSRSRMFSLFETGVLREVKSGAGRCVVVKSPAHLREFIRNEYPSGLEPVTDCIPPRASGVRMYRDSKHAASLRVEPVLLRGFDGACLISDGTTFPVSELTASFGLASFMLGDDASMSFNGKIATVENAEVFACFEKLQTGIDLALYAGGRLSGRVLKWLASERMARCDIVHFGDWDPVGLDEYLRIKDACPGRTSLFVPDDLETLLERFGKRKLLSGSSATLLSRLASSDDESVQRVVAMMRRCNSGLEQEVLLACR